ncbi:hypothetical protein IR083_05200 [Dysgonomonas sp. GY75]|uniref:hypothetical protein n=1 Tax=Dysgonomonas sp. GY75 TaxID=2780419 RepID=UPI0019FD6C36|nr:hypothetical protein [Dysgonomonas sp. GY75]MBF0648204.1 hypothetical protein [Dysgonomonas sp. GY75]
MEKFKNKYVIIFIIYLLYNICNFSSLIAQNDHGIDTDWYIKSSDTFLISSSSQLRGLSKLVIKGNNFKGKKIKLEKDIFLNDTIGWQNGERGTNIRTQWIP